MQAAATNQDENGAVGRLTEGGRSPTVVSLYPRRASFLMGRRGERLRCDSARNESYGASGQEDEPVGRPLVRFRRGGGSQYPPFLRHRILRAGIFGQHRGFSGQLRQSRVLAT